MDLGMGKKATEAANTGYKDGHETVFLKRDR